MPLLLVLQTASTTPDAVVAAASAFTNFLLGYVGALAAVGALSMALIEAAKKLLDSRTRFQALRWTEWMQGGVFEPNVAANTYRDSGSARADLSLSKSTAYAELLQLCTGVPLSDAASAAASLFESKGHLPFNHAFYRADFPAHALFALDLEHMLGSIQEAADVALSAPRETPSLFFLMTAGADAKDIKGWYDEGPESIIAAAEPTAENRKTVKEHADRFARLRQIVKRKLDGFQVYAGDRWASWNQTVANLVGIVALFLILLWIKNRNPAASPSYVMIGVMSLFGGILAPVAKDLVTALKRAKDG